MSGEQKLEDLLNSSSEFEMVNDDFEVVDVKERKAKNDVSNEKVIRNDIDNHDKVIPSVKRTCPVMKRHVSNTKIVEPFLADAFVGLFLLAVCVTILATSNHETISRLSNIDKVLPEEAAERFLKTFDKHWELKDEDIFDDEYYLQKMNKKYTRDESIGDFLKNDRVGNGWLPHTAVFTDDGLLKIKFYRNKKLTDYYLAKRNKNIEGGYKFYRNVDLE